MYYQSDFKLPPFQPRFDYRRSLGQLRKSRLLKRNLEPEVIIKHENNDDDDIDNQPFIVKWFYNFCENTSIHGVKYIGQSELSWSERLFWSVLVFLAICGVAHISLELSQKFSSSPLSTVVESTIYPVSEIAYPAITICPSNRLHVQRSIEAESIFLPNATSETLQIFRHLLNSMNNIEFAALDEFEEDIFEYSSPDLIALNLTEVYEFTMLTCEELFTGKCWWRNKYYNCCDDFFELQNSEYGICFAFNSAVHDIGFYKSGNKSIHYPLRTSNYGEWSGLRIEMSTRTDIAMDHEMNGIRLQINHPDQWPNSANFVPAGSATFITIKPTFSYTTEDVRRLHPDQRQCLNDDESKSAMTLPGLKYLQMNCISECRQRYMERYCNCSVSLFFPLGMYVLEIHGPELNFLRRIRDCNFDDLKCLYEYNDVFNYEKPPSNNPYFDNDSEGMQCPCLPECHRIDYSIEITSNILSSGDNMTIDLHYQSANIVKYRTDVTFGWLDLMVAFGGIAGLFLGCSILSGVEIIYYIIIITLISLRKCKKHCDKIVEINTRQHRIHNVEKTNRNSKSNQKKVSNVQVQTIKVISVNDVDKNMRENAKSDNKKTRY